MPLLLGFAACEYAWYGADTIQQYQKTNPNMTFTPEAASGLAALYILALRSEVLGSCLRI